MNRPAPHTPAPIGPIGPMGPDDPRLTAYALDALDAADRAAAATLTAALPRDGASLTALQRQAILLRGTARPGRFQAPRHGARDLAPGRLPAGTEPLSG